MTRQRQARVIPAAMLVVGFGVGAATVWAAKSPAVPIDLKGDKKEVAERLLVKAEELAATGSWERIAVGRVRYLSGDKTRGATLFDGVLKAEPAASDCMRIAAVYAIAGEWDKAKPLLERAMTLKPNSDGIKIEAGSWYNVSGDRAKAEELFNAAFAKSPGDFWNHVGAASSYLGQHPF